MNNMLNITWVDNPTNISDNFIIEMNSQGKFYCFYDIPDDQTLINRINESDIAIIE